MSKHYRFLLGLSLAVSLVLSAAGARAANTISFQAVGDGSVKTGDAVQFAVTLNFSDSTLGGGFDLLFPQTDFSFKSFTFDADLGRDAAFDLLPAVNKLSIGFGNFNEITGNKKIGLLTLDALQNLTLVNTPVAGAPALLTARDNAFPAGAFVGASGDALNVQYDGVAILAANIPEPGTLLLLGSGLAGLAATLRRRA